MIDALELRIRTLLEGSRQAKERVHGRGSRTVVYDARADELTSRCAFS
jgi:hypothetical protein